MSVGEQELDILLASMNPTIHPDTFVFVTLPGSEKTAPPSLQPQVMVFQEAEGLTVISSKPAAEKMGLDYAFPCRMITLNIHSSLDAVGFLARILDTLKNLGIGVNPVSGFFHDHLFVPINKENLVLEALRDMSQEAKVNQL